MLIEFIIPTYDRIAPLESMLTSLLAQTDSRWKASVYIDSENEMSAEKIVKLLNDDRITYSYTGKRFNDWGHTPREVGKQASNADYVIMTGDDNYYCPTCVQDIITAAKDSPGFIYWDMVHSHYGYTFFECHPWINQIDMGAFATRTDLAKQIKLKTSYAADGEFVGEFVARFPNTEKIKIKKVLFVHN